MRDGPGEVAYGGTRVASYVPVGICNGDKVVALVRDIFRARNRYIMVVVY